MLISYLSKFARSLSLPEIMLETVEENTVCSKFILCLLSLSHASIFDLIFADNLLYNRFRDVLYRFASNAKMGLELD